MAVFDYGGDVRRALKGLGAVVLLLLVVACGTSTPSEKVSIHFTAQCIDGRELVNVWVESADGSNWSDWVTWEQERDQNNKHVGVFSHPLKTRDTAYEIHVGCGRKSQEPNSSDYKEWETTNVSEEKAWGDNVHFDCRANPGQTNGKCAIAQEKVLITPLCDGTAVAESLQVIPDEGMARAAARHSETSFAATLAHPHQPYTIRVTCQGPADKWEAESNIKKIGARSFSCTPPRVGSPYGLCTSHQP